MVDPWNWSLKYNNSLNHRFYSSCKMSKAYAALCCILWYFLPVGLSGQQDAALDITGRIREISTLRPVAGASVLIKEINKGTVSGADGHFTIDGIAVGKYTIMISHIGYQKVVKKIEINPGESLKINIFLEDSVFTTAPVEIVASQINSVFNQGLRMSTIDAKEITSAPVQNISQIIDHTPGVLTNNTTGIYSSRVIVTMRGMPANDQGRTLVVMDGIPLNKADGGSVNWNIFNKDNVERITIVKGPGPAKYGSGAMGGVIEIETKKQTDRIAGSLNLEYGSYNTFTGELVLSGLEKVNQKEQQFFWGLNLLGRNSDGYVTTPEVYHTIEDTIIVPSFMEEYMLTFKTGYDFGKNHVVEGQILFFDDMRGNGVQVFDDFGAYSKHRTLNSVLKYSGFSGYMKWRMNIFNNSENYFRIYEYMREGEYKLYEADALRGDMGLQLDFDYFRLNDHKISFGIQAKSGKVKGSDTYYTSTDIISNAGKMDLLSFYAQDEISLMDRRLHVNAGVRYDYARFYDALFSIDFPSYSIAFYENFQTKDLPVKRWDAFSPRISVRYNASERSRLFLSYARGFRAPNLDDLCRTGSRQSTFAIANPDLKPELINAFEVGGDLQADKQLLLSMSVFYSIGKDFMYYTSTGDSVNMGYRLAPIITKSNIGEVGIRGFEAEMKYDFNESISCFGNYTFTHAKITDHKIYDVQIDSNLQGKYLTDIPQHKISGGIKWYHKIMNSSLLFRYYGPAWINEWNTIEPEYFAKDKFEGYSVFNIRLERTFFSRFTAALQIENIFDKKYVDNRLMQNPGRMIFIKVGADLLKEKNLQTDLQDF
jgi:outer membrane receptor protein involved in Fe transport